MQETDRARPENELDILSWLWQVNYAIWEFSAMSIYDFPEFDFAALYAVGSTPNQASDAAFLSISYCRRC